MRPQERQRMFADAEAYERFMGRWSRLVAPLLLEFAGIADGSRVLDVGSGTGSLAFEMARRWPRCQVVGIDPSKEYVAYASAREHGSNVRFESGDAQALSFPTGSFDACVSLLVFNFIPDPRKALSELRRVTRPGGVIAAANWDYGDGMRMLRAFWDAAVALDRAAEKLDEKHMPLCRAGELATSWKAAGLKDVEERPIEIKMHFQSFDDYWRPFLEGQGPAGAYVAKLSPERRGLLRTEVQRHLPAAAGNGAFELGGRVWAVRGTVPA